MRSQRYACALKSRSLVAILGAAFFMAVVRTKNLRVSASFAWYLSYLAHAWPLVLRPSMAKRLRKLAAPKQGTLADSTMSGSGSRRLGSGIRDYLEVKIMY